MTDGQRGNRTPDTRIFSPLPCQGLKPLLGITSPEGLDLPRASTPTPPRLGAAFRVQPTVLQDFRQGRAGASAHGKRKGAERFRPIRPLKGRLGPWVVLKDEVAERHPSTSSATSTFTRASSSRASARRRAR